MARTDAIVLGAGIVGTAIALHLPSAWLSVALVDRRVRARRRPTAMPASSKGTRSSTGFSTRLVALARIALKRAPRRTTISLSAEGRAVAPGLRAWSQPSAWRDRTGDAAAVRARVGRARGADGEAAPRTSCAKTGWLKLYRSDASSAAIRREREVAAHFGFRSACSIGRRPARSSPRSARYPARAQLGGRDQHLQSAPLTRAYAAASPTLGGVNDRGGRTLAPSQWRALGIDTEGGSVDATDAVVALGPWRPTCSPPRNQLPMAVEARYHRIFVRRQCRAGAAGLDADVGYAWRR